MTAHRRALLGGCAGSVAGALRWLEHHPRMVRRPASAGNGVHPTPGRALPTLCASPTGPVRARAVTLRGCRRANPRPTRPALSQVSETRYGAGSQEAAWDISLGVDLGTTFVAAAIAHGSRVEMFTLGDRTVVDPGRGLPARRRHPRHRRRRGPARGQQPGPGRPGVQAPPRRPDAGRARRRPATRSPRCSARCCTTSSTRVTETEGAPARRASCSPTRPTGGPTGASCSRRSRSSRALTGAAMVTEPEAAAAHYAASRHLDRRRDRSPSTTSAAARSTPPCCASASGGIEILGIPEGIERLGGVDFDEAILSHVNYSSGGALSELDLSDPQTGIALARLRQDCVAGQGGAVDRHRGDHPGVPAQPALRRPAHPRRVRGHDPGADRVDDRRADPHAALGAGRRRPTSAPCCWSAARPGSRWSPR